MTNITFWGLTASLYQLKMQALADYAGVPWQRFPEQANSPRALALFTRLRLARMQNNLARRQVRRCPYLFSVAPAGYSCDMPSELIAPSRNGFPATHQLLDRTADIMEEVAPHTYRWLQRRAPHKRGHANPHGHADATAENYRRNPPPTDATE